MTAEIAIINRAAIAVAADSAATIGRKKVWKSANKIFSLGPWQDVGVMFYGSADFFGCHWEIIIKQFRTSTCSKSYAKVDEAVEDFLIFIRDSKWQDDSVSEIAEAHLIAKCVYEIKDEIEYETVMEFRSRLKDACAALIEDLGERKVCVELTKADFLIKHQDLIKSFIEEIFSQKPVRTVWQPVADYIYEYVRRSECSSGFETGIVFFGYGESEIYPSLYEIVVDGSICGLLRSWHRRSMDLGKNRKGKGGIIPFAQTDVAALFMEGISPLFVSFFTAALNAALQEKDESYENRIPDDEKPVEAILRDQENTAILEEFSNAFAAIRTREVVYPVVDSIHSLPRDEMAAMAEALVDLTSMRRKVDSHLDTVGGAVDVAVVSKGEGFVWIKRKTYFDIDDNPDYEARRRFRLKRTDP